MGLGDGIRGMGERKGFPLFEKVESFIIPRNWVFARKGTQAVLAPPPPPLPLLAPNFGGGETPHLACRGGMRGQCVFLPCVHWGRKGFGVCFSKDELAKNCFFPPPPLLLPPCINISIWATNSPWHSPSFFGEGRECVWTLLGDPAQIPFQFALLLLLLLSSRRRSLRPSFALCFWGAQKYFLLLQTFEPVRMGKRTSNSTVPVLYLVYASTCRFLGVSGRIHLFCYCGRYNLRA